MRRRLHVRLVVRALMAAVLTASACLGVAPAASAQQVAFEDVVSGLKSGEARVRLESLRLLRSAGYLAAVPAIAPLMADPDQRVQAAAVEAIVSLYLVDENYTRSYAQGQVKEKGATLPLYAFIQGTGATVANVPPAAVIRGLIEAAGSANTGTRFDAAYALGVLGGPLVGQGRFPDSRAAANSLLAILRESDPTMRLAATHVLGRLMGAANRHPAGNAELAAQRTEIGDQIVGGMNDPDAMIRLSSTGALGEMRYDRAVQSLTDRYVYYKEGPEAMAALDAVARIGHPGSLPLFLAQLGHQDAQVRRLAVEGIARTADADAIARMESRTAEDQAAVVRRARAFGRATRGDYSQLATLVEGFTSSLLESDTFDYLIELGAPAAAGIASFSSHKDARVRAGVVEVLGVIGARSSLGVIEGLMRDRSAVVAAAARRSQMRLVPRAEASPRVP